MMLEVYHRVFLLTCPPTLTLQTKRTRSMAALFAGVGFSATGFIALVTVTPLVAEDLLGSSRWSGFPSSLAIVGTAFGTTWLSAVMSRHGRKKGLLVGYFTAAAAASVAALGAGLELFPLLAVAIFGLGAGYGASRLSRYAASDLYAPEQQARAISWVVWAGTFGSVLGPTLLEPSRRFSVSLGGSSTVGPFLLVALAMGAAGTVVWLGLPKDSHRPSGRPRARATFDQLRTPNAQTALLALVVGQVVMLLIMTMTPVHIRGAGGGLSSIGIVIAAHTFGMYALSPLSGWLCDRIGRRPTIVVAGTLLVTAAVTSATAGSSTPHLATGLFLLGWGWNLGFVAGSALLTESVPQEDRMPVQGLADSIVWTSAAVAGLSSGLLQDLAGFAVLCSVGAVMALAPMSFVTFRRPIRGV